MADEQTLTPPPIHHWTMDNITGATVNDEMGNTNLTNTGMVSVPGVFNNGLSASGSSANRLTADSAISFKTITMRISRSNLANYTNILMSSDGQHVLAIHPNNVATFNVIYIWNSGSVYETDLPMADTDWHFLVIREQNDGNAHDVYLDGVWSTTYLNTGLGGEFLYLGRSNEVSGQEVANFDDVQIYDRKLTDAEIRELWSFHTVPFRNSLEQLYELSLPYYRALLDQDYSLLATYRALLDQIFSLRMLAVFDQPIDDARLRRQYLDQRYGDAPVLRRLFDQGIHDTYKYRTEVEQLYVLQAGMRNMLVQKWSTSESRYLAKCDQVYTIQNRDLLRQAMEQLYYLESGHALVERPSISVTCDGVEHFTFFNINLEQSGDFWYLTGELQFFCGQQKVDGVMVDTAVEYLQYQKWSNEVVVTINDIEINFITEIPRRSRPGSARDIMIIPLRSPTILLGAPHNQQTAATFTGMASQLAADLAAPFSVDWQIVDWFIPEGILTGLGQSAMDVITEFVGEAGGMVQSSLDGTTLIITKYYPKSVNALEGETPDIEVNDQDSLFSVTSSPDSRPGYNKYFITDQQVSGDGVSMRHELISATRAEVRVHKVPWDDRFTCRLLHSGGSWVSVFADGVLEEEVTIEDVEIKSGTARLSLPCYGLVSHQYKHTDLGTIEIDEYGNVTTAVSGNSLVDLVYTTRSWKFIAADNQIEKVQFFPEVYRV